MAGFAKARPRSTEETVTLIVALLTVSLFFTLSSSQRETMFPCCLIAMLIFSFSQTRKQSCNGKELFDLKHALEMSVANIVRVIRDHITHSADKQEVQSLIETRGKTYTENHPRQRCIHILSDIDGEQENEGCCLSGLLKSWE